MVNLGYYYFGQPHSTYLPYVLYIYKYQRYTTTYTVHVCMIMYVQYIHVLFICLQLNSVYPFWYGDLGSFETVFHV